MAGQVHLLDADLLLDVMDPAALQGVRLAPRRAVPARVGLPHRRGALPSRVVVYRQLDRSGERLVRVRVRIGVRVRVRARARARARG